MTKHVLILAPFLALFFISLASAATAQQAEDSPVVTLVLPKHVAESIENNITNTAKPVLLISKAEQNYLASQSAPPEQAKELLLSSAEAGYAPAQYKMGLSYLSPDWGVDGYPKALHWLKLAAAQGHEEAKLRQRETELRVERQRIAANVHRKKKAQQARAQQQRIAEEQTAQTPSCGAILQNGYFVCDSVSNSYACANYQCEYHWECRREKRVPKGNGHVRVVEGKDTTRYGQCRTPSRGPGGYNKHYCDPRTGKTDDDFMDLFNKVCS